MSSFLCDKCQAEIIEGEGGIYITGCEHYPLSDFIKKHNLKIADEIVELVCSNFCKEKFNCGDDCEGLKVLEKIKWLTLAEQRNRGK